MLEQNCTYVNKNIGTIAFPQTHFDKYRPLVNMKDSIEDWFAAFYAASDDGNAHERYTTFFASDAKLIMGDTVAVGSAGMRRSIIIPLGDRDVNPEIGGRYS